MPKLAIDLRSLNYPVRTGVNIYFLNVLKVISEIKSKNSNLEVIGFGLYQHDKTNLEKEFDWFINLFDKIYSPKNKLIGKFYQAISWAFNVISVVKINSSLIFFNCGINFYSLPANVTHLFQPQIKPIILPSSINWVIATHDFFYLQISGWTNWLLQPNQLTLLGNNLLLNCNYVWANSISTANQIQQFFPEIKMQEKHLNVNKIQLVYPANSNYYTKSKTTYKTKLKNIQKNKYFVALAGIEPRKNWFNLLQAWKILEEKLNWNYTLVLAGRVVDQTYYEDLINLIQNLNLKNVVWKLNISEIEKGELLSGCVALVYPSLFEGFGFPILEAWQSGVPAIVGNMGSSMEIGQGGVLAVNPMDVEDIAAAIELLALDEEFRQILIANGRIRLQNFSWVEYKNRLEEWLKL